MAKGDGFAVCTMKKQSGGGGGLSAHIDREVYDAELDRMIPFRPVQQVYVMIRVLFLIVNASNRQ